MNQNPTKNQIAHALSQEIVIDIENGQLPLSTIALKAMRLSTILDDSSSKEIFKHELSGYQEQSTFAAKAGRIIKERSRWGQESKKIYLESIRELEENLRIRQELLSQLDEKKPWDSSENWHGHIHAPVTTSHEEIFTRMAILENVKKLENRKQFIYDYAIGKNLEMAPKS